MAGHRPADWHVLDLDKDPTPGDPQRVRTLAKHLHDFADDVSDALRLVKGMAGEGTLLEWAGKSADVFKEDFADVPKNLKKLKKSYEMCGDALADFWPKLERAQSLADKALRKGREARDSLSSAQSRLTSADSWVTRAGKEADKYKDDPTGSKGAEKPDEAKVRAATRDVQHAESAQSKAQSDVSDAQDALAAAKKMAADARKMRDEAAREAKSKIDEASDAGIQNRSWWEEVGDWFVDNWDTIVAVCKVVVAVVGIVAMIIGGPILGAIVLIAAAVVLADTLYKYSKGQASLWDVGLAALDCIPGMKGLTTLGGLAKGLKVLGRGGLKGMALGVKGLGRSAKGLVGDGAKGAYNRLKTKIFGCGDPVDIATGAMYLQQTDVELPGLLPLVFTRRASSNYRCGWWFGPTWASTLDQRLEVSDGSAVFVTEDGMLLTYETPSTTGACSYPDQGPRWPLTLLDGGGFEIQDHDTGHTRTFAPAIRGLALLDEISDRNGTSITFDYEPDGTPLAMRHSGGYHLTFTVADDRVRALHLRGAGEDGADVTVKRFLYTDGRLTGIVGSAGAPLRLTYDDQHRITAWTDTNGSSYRYTYDERGRCTAQGGEAGHVSFTFAYDGIDGDRPGHRVTTVTSASGASSRYVINADSQVVADVDPLGGRRTRTYDSNHHLLSHTDPLGRTTRVEYDGEGRCAAVVRPDGARSEYTYNALGLAVMVALPDRTSVRSSYDEKGNRTAVTDPDGATSKYAYSAAGHLRGITDALGHTTTIRTDKAGLPVEITDPLGGVIRHERDAFGRTVRLTDQMGHVTSLEWSVEGWLTRQTDADGTEAWEYDGEGNCLRHEDTAGHVTTYEYTHFDLLSARTDSAGTRFTYSYDADLRLSQVTAPTGDTWRYIYDAAGRMVSETDFDGATTRYAYDLAGQLTARTNSMGQTIHMEHDILGRMLRKRLDGKTTNFRYDLGGRLTEAMSPEATVTVTHDETGRILTETTNGRHLTHTYDLTGRRRSRTTPSGAVSNWSYDSAGSAVEFVTSGNTISFDRDGLGQELARRFGDRTVLANTYDPRGRRLTQNLVHDGHTRGWRRYSYRSDGYLRDIEDSAGARSGYETDLTGRVTAVHGPQGTERYGYDAQGNQTHASWPAVFPGQEAVGDRRYRGLRLERAGGVRYEYDAQGRITLRQKTRLSRRPDTWRYEWDAEDRLTAVTTPDGTRWTYLYDPLGRRIAKQRHTADGVGIAERTDFVWDGTTLCEQRTWSVDQPQAVVLTWDHQGQHPIAQTERILDADAGQQEIDRRFFGIVTDLIGTPTELVDEEGEIAWLARATLWGATTWSRTARAYTPLRFPGQYFDLETGLHYNVFRYYDPETARYLSSDPLGLAASPNPATYVHNALTWSDPLGLTPCEDAARQAAARNETVLGPNVPARTEASVGSAASHNYKKTFFEAHPGLKGKVVVHHAIEQQVLKRYPGLFSADEMHSLENLRGIPKGDINSRVHLSQIRVEWNRFYEANPNPTRQEVLDQVTRVDDMLGNWFSPRIR